MTATNAAGSLFALSLLLAPAGAVAQQGGDDYRLTILHTNDTHAHHEPQSRSGVGGAARQASVVKTLRDGAANSVLVDAGDRFTGTLYHQYYRGDDNRRIMNALGYDVMALGNHEFDNGLEVLAAFVGGLEFPALAANVDFSALPELAGRIKASTVLEVGGEKLGFIGLVTAETPDITMQFPGKDKLRFRDDYAAVVNAEAERLGAAGVNKIFVVSHIGLGVDIELARRSRGVDAIIGGHSHTAVSSVYKEGGETDYPIEIDNADGEPVYIVQAGDRDRYVGELRLRFDAAGRVTRARGDLILLSRFIAPDAALQRLIDELAAPIKRLKNTPVEGEPGSPVVSRLLLSNRDCRQQECLLGNLVADATRAETGAQIAIQNGGGLRADIDEGEVTIGDVLTVLPFGNTVATLTLSGADVVAALENGVSRVGASSGSGRFPQVSGLRFSFDAARPPGRRIVGVEVQTGDGGFAPLDPQQRYRVATNNFMRTGGDGYQVFAERAADPYDHGRPLEEALIDYMIANAPLEPRLENRIRAAQ